MDPISPTDMILFSVVVREGGFTRAAIQLGVTKQTVSERIAKLEARLGVRLLERTTRRLRVTDSGAIYYQRCAAIAAQIDEANNEVLDRQAEPTGLLRVSAPVLYGRAFLSPVITLLVTRHPKLRIEVALADRRVDLIEEGFDLAIRIGELDDSSLAAKRIGEGHAYLVASPRLLKGRRPLTAETVRALPAIGLRPNETWPVGEERLEISPRVVVNDHAMACAAAIDGLGLALLPSLICRDAVLDGRLEIVLGPDPTLVRPVFAVFPSRLYVPPKVRVFLEALAELVTPMPVLRPPRTVRAAHGRASRSRSTKRAR